ncbi:putative xenobiotic-transporting ATPase [Medicago truncatula]|uniref:Putative xenobiotic-transporting ATPase n=1 Tax=Medicago truncatula TaxID=3880 RepID=A0A396IW40_MEDTR|nr:putative xenobiotic-transporting ATPase [Medicago truncatula]
MAPPGRPKKVVQMADITEEENGHDDDEMKKNVVRALPFFKLLSYADYVDWILMGLGTLGSIVHGMALPVGYLLLGKALNAFGNNINNIDAMVPALKKVPTDTIITHFYTRF